MTEVAFPWPPPAVGPNKTGKLRDRMVARRDYREACAAVCGRSERLALPAIGGIALEIDFYPPDNYRRDLDNMLAGFKLGLDAFSKAHGIDDRRFAQLTIRRLSSLPDGKVVVRVTHGAGA